MLKIKVNPHDRASVLAAFIVTSALMNKFDVVERGTGVENPTPLANVPEPGTGVENPTPPPAKKKSTPKAAASVEEPKVIEAPAEKTPVVETTATSEEPGVTLKDLRELLAEKVDDHRDKILAKLQSFGGAKNMTSLDPVHYPAMYNFLKGL